MKSGLPSLLLVTHLIASPLAHGQDAAAPPIDRYPEIMQAIQAKEFDKALATLGPLRAEFPENAEILLFEIAALEGAKESVRCASLAEDFIRKHPDSINLDQAYYLLGSARIAAGSPEEGGVALRKAREVTDDPSLIDRIDGMLGGKPEPTQRPMGISLGGKPPASPEERKMYAEVSLRILRRAIEDFQSASGAPPGRIEDLLEGDPPVLSRLPLNPLSADGRFAYRRTADGYELSESAGK